MIDDDEDEDVETFILEIVEVDPDDPRVNVTDGITTVIVVDEDGEYIVNLIKGAWYSNCDAD